MSSSFRTLSALLVAASSCSLAFSIPSSGNAALSKRSFPDYVDNLIYLDANKTGLYTAIEIEQETYAAFIDTKWDGLLVHGNSTLSASNSSVASKHSIVVEEISVTVEDDRGEVGWLEVDLQGVEYFTVPEWPSSLPSTDIDGVGKAYIGLDVNNGMSPAYNYFDARWPEDYSKWFYDILISYDWNDSNATEVDFAGVLIAGKTLNWTDFLDISESQASSYGLPSLDQIDSQSPVYLSDEGTISIDNTFTANGQQVSFTSQVFNATAGTLVADVYFSRRWSMFPDNVVQALYGNLSGATFVPESTFGFWQISCDSQVSFSFSINGTKYDVDADALIAPNPFGSGCIGSIFTKGQAVSAAPEFDVIFGFQFMSSFYFRAGIDETTDKPYYKFLALQVPSGGWDGSMPAVSTMSYGTAAATGATASTSSSSTVSVATSTLATTSAPTTTSVSTTVSSGTSTTATSAVPSGTGAISAAGNLAEEDSTDGESADYWKKQYDTFRLTTIILAAVSGALLLGLIGGLIALSAAKRKAANGRPSAYRSLHDMESNEPKASLYDSEGGQSRYADPYQDHH